MAIASCPKTCGYCCETAAYDCTNAPCMCFSLLQSQNFLDPRINCATITSEMCQSTQWRTIIASDCPSACGFCLLGGCVDAAPDCASQPTICVTTGLESFVQANCQRTCGLCSSSSTSTTAASSSTCSDSSSSCSTWNTNGFCSSTFYTSAQKASYCAKTCGLCSGK